MNEDDVIFTEAPISASQVEIIRKTWGERLRTKYDLNDVIEPFWFPKDEGVVLER